MVPLAAATAVSLLGGWLALRRWGVPTGWNHAVVAGIAVHPGVNSLAPP